MIKWSIKFIIQEIRSEESISYHKGIVKKKTVVDMEIEDTDLNKILICNDSFKTKFSFDKLFEEDKKSILKSEISEKMLIEYYVNGYELNFTDRSGVIYLYYPKINLR